MDRWTLPVLVHFLTHIKTCYKTAWVTCTLGSWPQGQGHRVSNFEITRNSLLKETQLSSKQNLCNILVGEKEHFNLKHYSQSYRLTNTQTEGQTINYTSLFIQSQRIKELKTSFDLYCIFSRYVLKCFTL